MLLVDDAPEVRAVLAEILVREGFAVVEGANGREAITKAVALQPHVIVLDVSLPGMSGIEAAWVLRSKGVTRTTPVIALTGHALLPAQREVFDYVLTKPCVPDVLVWRIRALLPQGLALGA